MRNGDLSNEPAPRIYVVFDEAIGSVPEKQKELFSRLVGEGKNSEAMDLIDLNSSILNRIGWLSVRKNVNIYLVTWLTQGMAQEIEEVIGETCPIRGCLSLTYGQLARMTAQDDSVTGIYDPDPMHALSYGAKGRVIKDERDLI